MGKHSPECLKVLNEVLERLEEGKMLFYWILTFFTPGLTTRWGLQVRSTPVNQEETDGDSFIPKQNNYFYKKAKWYANFSFAIS